MFHLGAQYFVTDTNLLCSDLGMEIINDVDSCQRAVSTLPNERIFYMYIGKVNAEDQPKGCFSWPAMGRVHFNTHKTGNRNLQSSHMCIVPAGKNICFNF